MTQAEQKAKELIETFFNVNDPKKEDKGTNPFISREYAKQCALICVDENKETLEKLESWLIEFDDKKVKPTYRNMVEKVWELLSENRNLKTAIQKI